MATKRGACDKEDIYEKIDPTKKERKFIDALVEINDDKGWGWRDPKTHFHINFEKRIHETYEGVNILGVYYYTDPLFRFLYWWGKKTKGLQREICLMLLKGIHVYLINQRYLVL